MLAKKLRKTLALFLALTMVLSLAGLTALAGDGPAHLAECTCGHVCSRESGCVTTVPCDHSGDCAYQEAVYSDCDCEMPEGAHTAGCASHTVLTEAVPCSYPDGVEQTVCVHVHSDSCVWTCAEGCPVTAGSNPGSGAIEVSNTEEFLTALANCEAGATIKLANGIYEIGAVELEKAVTIEGSGSTVITVKPETNRNNTGERFGFFFKKAIDGDVTFRNLTINGSENNLALLWICNTDPAGVSVSLENCTLWNVGSATYNHAVSYEYASGASKYYFDLTISNCSITASSYGVGSGLDNGIPDVSDCSLSVSDTLFNNGQGSGSIYCIHAPKALAALTVTGCSFNTVTSGGIKYIFNGDNQNAVSITDNDFSGCNSGMASGSYALMVTNQIKDLANKNCYAFATKLSGNDFSGQNTIIAAAAALETFWFPDGQAVNATEFNNFSDTNTTDAGTRYGMSKWGGNQNFIVLTDFAITQDAMSFYVGDAAAETSYFYNSAESSGAYTNAKPDFAGYWSEANPRHCGASLATWAEANAITRWTLDEAAFVQDQDSAGDPLSTWTAENEIAKVVVDTATGKIQVTPKAVGTTELRAVVGAGQDGTLPNAKSDTLEIKVRNHSTPSTADYYTVTVNYLDKATGEKLAESFRSSSIREGRGWDFADKQLASLTADGVEYSYDSADGDALTGSNIRSNKVVNLYYVSTEDIGEEKVPGSDQPGETTDIGEDPVPGSGNPGEVTEIAGAEVPLGDAPNTGDSSLMIFLVLTALLSAAGAAALLLTGQSARNRR